MRRSYLGKRCRKKQWSLRRDERVQGTYTIKSMTYSDITDSVPRFNHAKDYNNLSSELWVTFCQRYQGTYSSVIETNSTEW